MLNLIEQKEILFTVAYLFKYSAWFRLIHSAVLETNHDISIEWEIPRTSSDWKNSAPDGGGPLNFYGVHFLWMLVHFGVNPQFIKICSKALDGSPDHIARHPLLRSARRQVWIPAVV